MITRNPLLEPALGILFAAACACLLLMYTDWPYPRVMAVTLVAGLIIFPGIRLFLNVLREKG